MESKVIDGLPPAKLRFIEPMYARSIQELPTGPGWQYEIKFDGYRCLAGRDERRVILWSRRANLFTSQFPEIARALDDLKPDTVLDGEIIAIDENGRVSFNLLQNSRSEAAAIQYFAFDLLMHAGRSFLRVPLHVRRQMLAEVIGGLGRDTSIRFSETIEAPPEVLVSAAKEMGFEGIMAKRIDSCYEVGKRTGSCLSTRSTKPRRLSLAATYRVIP